ncbi:MAG TPA: MoxR family ATPase [Candidatus Sumerlaeota bacterium]|nr:MoxR family ATPase [Candidatus Sumerlaeota bacterium]
MSVDILSLAEEVERQSVLVDRVASEIGKVIVGQKYMVDRLLIGLLANGHVLLEGVPGLAKTLTCKTLATTIAAKFSRIQFTPDLLPADLIGTLIFNQKDQTFDPKLGPIFSNIVLADEINRAPAKVQSALLEAMQERQVTIGERTYPLDNPFMVLATQNPIEQEGTYPLPEAQVDRFLFKLHVSYPTRDEERGIMDTMTSVSNPGGALVSLPTPTPVITPTEIREARKTVDRIYVDDKVKTYILNLVESTRFPDKFKLVFKSAEGRPLEQVISIGASPRASIALVVAAKAHAFMRHRGHVTPDDVKAIGPDVLRHRIMITFEAEAEEMTTDHIVRQIFDQIEVP